MVGNFVLPPTGYGPGSQPDEGDGELEYMQMPQDMRTFSPRIPDVEGCEALAPALALMAEVAAAAAVAGQGGPNVQFDLAALDAANRALVAETMGEGEVAMRVHGIPAIAVQESVFAGVWMLSGAGVDAVEVGPVPQLALERAFEPRMLPKSHAAPRGPGVVNAPPLLVELEDKSATFDPAATDMHLHTVNLTLLPHTEEDLAWLDAAMGKGAVEILSRGYGNCRITATALPHVWRVQFYNSTDQLILDTFEVVSLPEVALAAREDLTDSGARLVEVLEAIR
ncbi:hydrogenase expression/formation protein [Vannielia litorea]|uniref:hydrogenase expression/formation protein n=1 Tax=Vannielia litorea TaxID=1217970 RepID=UPI001BCEE456|nr:hydrogenase expression/formation protein [Vannielia litorea]MBS8228770.1 hydrogenase expression/formation protein [Vannielia litorea]